MKINKEIKAHGIKIIIPTTKCWNNYKFYFEFEINIQMLHINWNKFKFWLVAQIK